MDALLTLLAGFFASLHCVGMCGVIVIAYSAQLNGKMASPNQASAGILSKAAVSSTLPMHVAYNAGRMISYALLGGLAGALGGFVTPIRNASTYIAVIGGVLMMVTGILLLNIIPLPVWLTSGKMGRGAAQTVGRIIRDTTVSSKVILGFLTPLFPCGILYAMIIKAGASQSFISGALTMALFALGMAPALILTGTATNFFTARWRKIGNTLAAVTIILLGLVLLLRGLGVPYLGFLSGGPTAGEQPCCCH
jgi:sulfite exporter TauE/SafE